MTLVRSRPQEYLGCATFLFTGDSDLKKGVEVFVDIEFHETPPTT